MEWIFWIFLKNWSVLSHFQCFWSFIPAAYAPPRDSQRLIFSKFKNSPHLNDFYKCPEISPFHGGYTLVGSFYRVLILLRIVGYIRFCFTAVFHSSCLSLRRVSCTWVVRWVWTHLTTNVYHFNIFSDCAVFCIVYNNLICNRLKNQNIVIFLWWLILLICI